MNIVVCGGGTGGHLYPGIAIAKNYVKAGHKVYYIASNTGIDREIISSLDIEGIEVFYWNLRGLQRKITIKNILKNIQNIYFLANTMYKSKTFLKNKKINLVVGVGGYISFPVVYTASKMGIYTMIHEQNSYPGLVNRKLAKYVQKIGITYESSRIFFDNYTSKIINISNPRVNECMEYLHKDFSKELGLSSKKKILFLGGSLGADKINELFEKVIDSDLKNDYQFILISGLKNNQVKKKNMDDIILENTSDLLKYITSSDLIVSRAGASTLIEIIYLEKKSLIIPSPNVVKNHQLTNAQEFSKQGLLEYIEEKNINLDNFKEEIKKVQKNRKMEKKLQKFVKINSLELFNNIVEEIDDNRKNN